MDDHPVRPLPLDGLEVIDLGTMVTAPLTAMMLADMGASVLKVENPRGGDPFRRFRSGLYSPNFVAYNRNKRSLALNLKSGEALAVLKKLIERADVLVENFRPGVMSRLGLDWDRIRKINPRLVLCSITGFGATGPYSGRPAFDTVGLALSGVQSLFVDPDDPHVAGPTIADNVTGMYACSGVLGALFERQQSGIGRHVEVNMLESSIALIPDPIANYTQAGICNDRITRVAASHSFVFRCADGRMIALHLSFPEKFWQGFLVAIDRPDIGRDDRFATRENRIANYEALEAELAAAIETRPREHWIAAFEENDLPFAPVNAIPDVFNDPQVRHLGTFSEVEHPVEGRVVGIQCPISIDGVRSTLMAPPVLGEHTDEVLAELGYSETEISALRAASAV